jgi:hypothetical protein
VLLSSFLWWLRDLEGLEVLKVPLLLMQKMVLVAVAVSARKIATVSANLLIEE